MPTFVFEAHDSEGRLIEGKITERNELRALERLRKAKAGLEVRSLRLTSPTGPTAWVAKLQRVSKYDLARVFRILALALSSGVGIARGVRMLADSSMGPRMQAALEAVERDLHAGARLSQALLRHPSVFPRDVVGALKVSEGTGGLDQALGYIADALEREAERAQRLASALAYPAVLVVLSVAMIGGMLVFFLPRMAEAIRSFGVEPALPTRLLLAVTDFLSNGATMALIAESVLFALGMGYLWLQSEDGRQWWDESVLKVPLLERVVQSAALSRLAHSLAMSARCGMSLSQALGLASGTLGNRVLDAEVGRVKEFVVHGATLAQAIRAQPHLDQTFAIMVGVAEESGQLEDAMVRLHRIYDERLDHVLDLATSLVEPLVMAFMGGVVGITAVAFLLPLAQLVRSL